MKRLIIATLALAAIALGGCASVKDIERPDDSDMLYRPPENLAPDDNAYVAFVAATNALARSDRVSAFAHFRDAARRPVWYQGFADWTPEWTMSGFADTMPVFPTMGFSRLWDEFLEEARLKAARGDFDGALDDVADVFALSHTVVHGDCTELGILCALGMRTIASDVLVEIAAAEEASDGQLERALALLNGAEPAMKILPSQLKQEYMCFDKTQRTIPDQFKPRESDFKPNRFRAAYLAILRRACDLAERDCDAKAWDELKAMVDEMDWTDNIEGRKLAEFFSFCIRGEASILADGDRELDKRRVTVAEALYKRRGEESADVKPPADEGRIVKCVLTGDAVKAIAEREALEAKREGSPLPLALRLHIEAEGKDRADGLWGTDRHSALLLLAIFRHADLFWNPSSKDTKHVFLAIRNLSGKVVNGVPFADEDRFVIACALVEAWGMGYCKTETISRAIEQEVRFIVESQGADGLWGDGLRTAWAAQTLSALSWSKFELPVEGLEECRARAVAQAEKLVLDGKASEMEVCAAVWLSRKRSVWDEAARRLAGRMPSEPLTEADVHIARANVSLWLAGSKKGGEQFTLWQNAIKKRIIERAWEREGTDSICLHFLAFEHPGRHLSIELDEPPRPTKTSEGGALFQTEDGVAVEVEL